QSDPHAVVFLATVVSKRALALVERDSLAAAVRDATRALGLWRANPDSRYALAEVAMREGQPALAEAQLDTLLALRPTDRGALELLDQVRAAGAPRPPASSPR